MSERKTLEEFQELECRSRNMRPFQFLPVNKRRDITIISWQKFHDQQMKAKDAEIESLKQQITSNDKELDQNHQMIFELQHDLKEVRQQLSERGVVLIQPQKQCTYWSDGTIAANCKFCGKPKHIHAQAIGQTSN